VSPTAPFLASERDDPHRRGRLKASGGTNHFGIPGVSVSGLNTASYTAGRDYYMPFYVSSPIRIDRMACEVTVGSSGNLRMGVYRADADNQPTGAPLVDSGSIAITVAVKTFDPTTPLYLRRGRYLSVLNHDTGASFRIWRGSADVGGIPDGLGANAMMIGLYVARAYAAFPTPGTPWDTIQTSSTPFQHIIAYRTVSP